MYNQRPKLNIKLNPIDYTLEVSGALILAALWLWTIYGYGDLPDSIPVHFNAAGNPDRYGGKATLFVLPVIAAFLYAGLSILAKYPHIFNYPTAITAENALKQYKGATRLLRYLKTAIVVIFAMIAFHTNELAAGRETSLGALFLPLIIGFILVPSLLYAYFAYRNR